ncbi:hypothetical protein [Acinetobacter sp. 102]|uniref:hypothetical protein n=1 Tax=Acinetobacter sp. 102 TaxID=3098766 RepID=UPI003009EA19
MDKKNIALWIFGVLFIFAGFGAFGRSFIGGVLYILGGIALLPPVQIKSSSIFGKTISIKWFVIFTFIMMLIAPIVIRSSEQRAIQNGTASKELIEREERMKSYSEEREKQEKLREERIKAEDRERESRKYNSSPSTIMSFDECKQKALSVQVAVAGTQYKSAVLVDSDIAYMARICTNDGSVLITCSALDKKMITTKSNDCPI